MSKITQKKKELKKINQILPEVTYISVIDDSYTEVTRERDPNEEYSGDDTDTSHNITGIKIHPKYGDIECSFKVEPATDYYLLYYLYGTGDSFGLDKGLIEFVALYNDKKLADKSCYALNNTDYSKTRMATIWNDNGQKYEEHINNNYFGGFEGAEVVTVQLV